MTTTEQKPAETVEETANVTPASIPGDPTPGDPTPDTPTTGTADITLDTDNPAEGDTPEETPAIGHTVTGPKDMRAYKRKMAQIISRAVASESDYARNNSGDLVDVILPRDEKLTGYVQPLMLRHLTTTIALAKKNGWCAVTDDYLSRVWRGYAPAEPYFYGTAGTDMWHSPETGKSRTTGRSTGLCQGGDNTFDHCGCGHECDRNCRVGNGGSTGAGTHRFERSGIVNSDGIRQATCYYCGEGCLYDVPDDMNGVTRYFLADGREAGEIRCDVMKRERRSEVERRMYDMNIDSGVSYDRAAFVNAVITDWQAGGERARLRYYPISRMWQILLATPGTKVPNSDGTFN